MGALFAAMESPVANVEFRYGYIIGLLHGLQQHLDVLDDADELAWLDCLYEAAVEINDRSL